LKGTDHTRTTLGQGGLGQGGLAFGGQLEYPLAQISVVLVSREAIWFQPSASGNATGNYVKVVQGIPVRIDLDPRENKDHRLQPGMSVNPKVYLNQ